MKKYIYIFLGLLLITCNFPANYNYCHTNITESLNLELLKQQASQCFDNAEKEVFKPKPDVKPNDGTNPDASKCICKGTGIIVQGDGHKTQCPYHYKTDSMRNKNAK